VLILELKLLLIRDLCGFRVYVIVLYLCQNWWNWSIRML